MDDKYHKEKKKEIDIEYNSKEQSFNPEEQIEELEEKGQDLLKELENDEEHEESELGVELNKEGSLDTKTDSNTLEEKEFDAEKFDDFSDYEKQKKKREEKKDEEEF